MYAATNLIDGTDCFQHSEALKTASAILVKELIQHHGYSASLLA